MYEFASSQALLDYATHRLLYSWYRRDRDAQSPGMDANESDVGGVGDGDGTEPDTDADMDVDDD